MKRGPTAMKKRRAARPTKRANHAPKKWAGEQAVLLLQAVENCSDLIGMTDVEGKVTFANQGFLDTLGYTKQEFIGKHFSAALSPSNPPALVQEIAEKMLQEHGWRGECEGQRRDGSAFPAYLSVGPVKDNRGRVIGSFGIARDITRFKLADKAIQESEERFRQIAENIPEVFFVMETAPVNVTYVSPAYEEIWGRPREELYSRASAWVDSVQPEDRPRVIANFENQIHSDSTQIEYRIIRPDGSVRWISNRTFAVRDTGGRIHRVVGLVEDITVRHHEEAALRAAHEKLRQALSEETSHAKQAEKLTELVDILQSCQTVEEAYRIAGKAVPNIIPCSAGALCITSPSRNTVEAAVTWGEHPATDRAFAPENCWALRRGKTHVVDNPASPMRCTHVPASAPGGYVCVPLAAQGETLGVLCLMASAAAAGASQSQIDEQLEILKRQGAAVGERISLALANLRLRDVLRTQSIRDPLTGLFNRRYMEESLERELRRAERNNQTVSLVMLDIDHFKRFNDTFGHQAGDTLLRALGDFLSQRTRGQDVACRYGGEEFALILAGASAADAAKRSELLREELTHLAVSHAGQVLGRVTFSMGVAAYPTHATSTEQLLRAADEALYRAKSEGRDRICIATPAPELHEPILAGS